MDWTPRYTPDKVIVTRNGKAFEAEVISAVAYLPGQHPHTSPIRADLTAIELRTRMGSRWFGFEDAFIDSSLRMVVKGFPSADEVRSKWEIAS